MLNCLASNSRGSASSELPHEDDVDILQRGGEEAVVKAVTGGFKFLPSGLRQANMVLIDSNRNAIRHAMPYPNTVLVHVYDLKQGFQRSNEALPAMGVFHAGVEVYGSEWTYGVYGVDREVPRTATNHVYNCSIYLGRTGLSKQDVAALLNAMCPEWLAADYEILNHNCCSFSAEFCDLLDVGPLPPWINRFARLLHRGRQVPKEVGRRGRQVGNAVVAGLIGGTAVGAVNWWSGAIAGRNAEVDDSSPASSRRSLSPAGSSASSTSCPSPETVSKLRAISSKPRGQPTCCG